MVDDIPAPTDTQVWHIHLHSGQLETQQGADDGCLEQRAPAAIPRIAVLQQSPSRGAITANYLSPPPPSGLFLTCKKEKKIFAQFSLSSHVECSAAAKECGEVETVFLCGRLSWKGHGHGSVWTGLHALLSAWFCLSLVRGDSWPEGQDSPCCGSIGGEETLVNADVSKQAFKMIGGVHQTGWWTEAPRWRKTVLGIVLRVPSAAGSMRSLWGDLPTANTLIYFDFRWDLKSEVTISHQNSSGGNSPFIGYVSGEEDGAAHKIRHNIFRFILNIIITLVNLWVRNNPNFYISPPVGLYSNTRLGKCVCVCSLSCLSLLVCECIFICSRKINSCQHSLSVFTSWKSSSSTRSKNGHTARCFLLWMRWSAREAKGRACINCSGFPLRQLWRARSLIRRDFGGASSWRHGRSQPILRNHQVCEKNQTDYGL